MGHILIICSISSFSKVETAPPISPQASSILTCGDDLMYLSEVPE